MEISSKWDCSKSFDDLVIDAKFVFKYQNSNPMIVLKTPINGIDCIEIDQDRFGLVNGSEAVFNHQWGNKIIDSSQEIVEFIYLHFYASQIK